MPQLRQPRLAEIVAGRLRDDILTGRLREGDTLPRQEVLLSEFGVSLPAVREAMRILETEGLISVRRGNVGGATVHLPTSQRTAKMISMVLQSRGTTPSDVSEALLRLEPVCAGMCALRPDRARTVVPALRQVIDDQHAQFDDVASYNSNARRFHEALVDRCGNETMIVVIGSLETIWSAHESSVWNRAPDQASVDGPLDARTRRAALRDHERILAAIEAGNDARAVSLAGAHLAATRRTTLASNHTEVVNSNLVAAD